MAQRTQVLFIDDIDGGEAEGTVRFALDGTEYEIDLSGKHSGELRAALGTYVEHARRVGGAASVRGKKAGNAPKTQRDYDPAEFRARAKKLGYELKNRGRVPGNVVEAVRNGIPNPAQPTVTESAVPAAQEPPAEVPAAPEPPAAVEEKPQVKTRKPRAAKPVAAAAFSG